MKRNNIPLTNPESIGIALHLKYITPDDAVESAVLFKNGLKKLLCYLERTRKFQNLKDVQQSLSYKHYCRGNGSLKP